MVLFLLAVGIVLAVAVAFAWGVAHVSHTAFVAVRGSLRRGRS